VLRSHQEIFEQLTDLFPHSFAVNDHIDQSMLLEKLGSLESLGQILVGGFLDHARTGKSDHAARLGNDDIA